MKDQDLATRKIHEKRKRRKEVADTFRSITAPIPDFRQYSEIPAIEKVAALVGEEKRERAIENAALNRVVTQEEIDAHIAKMEAGSPLPQRQRNRFRKGRHISCGKATDISGSSNMRNAAVRLRRKTAYFAEQHEDSNVTGGARQVDV